MTTDDKVFPMNQRQWYATRTTLETVIWVLVLTVFACLALGGCDNPAPSRVPVIPETPQTTTSPSSPSPLAGQQQIPRYDPKYFGGTRWATAAPGPAGAHCTTRGIVLYNEARSTGTPADTDHDGCLDDGPFRDLYTGQMTDPTVTKVQIDHLFAEADAWRMGAWRWTPQQRWMFRNDQANLRATTADINDRKSDKGPDEWRPPDPAGWCGYARTYLTTALHYELIITPPRRAALNEMLATCTDPRPQSRR